MDRRGLGFPPCRIDRGGQMHVAIGTQGEMAKLGPTGEPTDSFTRPFPAPILDGVTLSDRWVGFWVEREFRVARMAALPLQGDWFDGPGRDDLRLSSLADSDIQPAGAIWHRILDAEPMAIGSVGGNIVFSTLGEGIYMIDSEAREIWRAQYPVWSEISDIGVQDLLVSIVESPEGIVVWSQAGGVAVLDPSDGSLLSSRVLELGDKLSNAIYAEGGGWLLMLHGGTIGLLENIGERPEVLETSGPVLDAQYDGREWRWTGWRHDGRLSEGRVFTAYREGIGVAILEGRVMTNDGEWSDYSA